MNEIKTNYDYDINNQNVKLLSLSNILLDRGMRLKINETCTDLAKEYKLKYLKKDTSLPLNNDKLSSIQSNIILDPIKVKQFKLTDYFEVIDGRHRYVYSLHQKYSSIPCIII